MLGVVTLLPVRLLEKHARHPPRHLGRPRPPRVRRHRHAHRAASTARCRAGAGCATASTAAARALRASGRSTSSCSSTASRSTSRCAWKREWASVLLDQPRARGGGRRRWWPRSAGRPSSWSQLPIVLIAGAIGVWLFYVQHQFEDTYWERDAGVELPPRRRPRQLVLRPAAVAALVHRQHRLPPHPPPLEPHPELPPARVPRATTPRCSSVTRLTLRDEPALRPPQAVGRGQAHPGGLAGAAPSAATLPVIVPSPAGEPDGLTCPEFRPPPAGGAAPEPAPARRRPPSTMTTIVARPRRSVTALRRPASRGAWRRSGRGGDCGTG